MSYYPFTTLVIQGDAASPVFRLSASGSPVIELIPAGDFRVTLGNHVDPAAYLRQMSRDAENLALEVEVEQARQARLAGDAA